ncbi:unnamed protein product [Lactuca virosa]|uniref:Uncharacterized protein n=1 Tax=Lactuca virosa TaxID=75947 RepID=A0AAU9MXP1_9ASTR|nr:unnamed protein product [Lactuca virosa]
MKEAQEQATNTVEIQSDGGRGSSKVVQYKWWILIAFFTMFVFSGQSTATMLGRLYFTKGGNSKWMATLVQTAGFLLMYPFIFLFSPSKTQPEYHQQVAGKPSLTTLVILYTTLGIFLAADCMLFTFGLNFLPVSTFSLISSDSEETGNVSRSKYIIGFVCTVAASAGWGLMLSITQLAFQKILKSTSYKVVFDMTVYQNLIASIGILMGLFASGEWKDIKGEMRGFESGQASYIMNLVGTAVAWQVFTYGFLMKR